MYDRHISYHPYVGCFLVCAVLVVLCLTPIFLLEAGTRALEKLHLSSSVAVLVIAGLLLGGLINIPVHVVERDQEQLEPDSFVYTLMGWVPIVQRTPRQTIVAVNVGGCVIPLALVVFEAMVVLSAQPAARVALLVALAANIAVCYVIARPMPGIGIVMPALVAPAVAVAATWCLLSADDYQMIRAPVAFVAGVLGPLIGADLLHLRDVLKLSAGVMSIGGAGTFDGIVLSGLLAAFLA